MPCHSLHNELLDELDEVQLALKKARLQRAIRNYDLSDSDSDDLDSDNSDLNTIITPPSPPTPFFSDSSDFDSSSNESDRFTAHYDCLNDTIISLCDEVIRACVLYQQNAPPM